MWCEEIKNKRQVGRQTIEKNNQWDMRKQKLYMGVPHKFQSNDTTLSLWAQTDVLLFRSCYIKTL